MWSILCDTYRIFTRFLIMYVRYRTVVLFTQHNQCHQINSCGPLLAWQHFSSFSYIIYFLFSIHFSELIWNREVLGPIYRYVTTVRFRCPIIQTPPVCVDSLTSSLCKFNCESSGLSVRNNDTLVHSSQSTNTPLPLFTQSIAFHSIALQSVFHFSSNDLYQLFFLHL